MHELVAMLHDGDLTVPCAKVEEEEHGVHLLDDDGERTAYVPYKHLEYVLPKDIASEAASVSTSSKSNAQSTDDSTRSSPPGKDPKRRDADN